MLVLKYNRISKYEQKESLTINTQWKGENLHFRPLLARR